MNVKFNFEIVTVNYHWFSLVQQYLHPFEAAKYKNTIRNARAFGRKCIEERIQAIESSKQTPNDILTHILQMLCEFNIWRDYDN